MSDKSEISDHKTVFILPNHLACHRPPAKQTTLVLRLAQDVDEATIAGWKKVLAFTRELDSYRNRVR